MNYKSKFNKFFILEIYKKILSENFYVSSSSNNYKTKLCIMTKLCKLFPNYYSYKTTVNTSENILLLYPFKNNTKFTKFFIEIPMYFYISKNYNKKF